MEKLKVKETTFDLIPMGINESEKSRSYTISSADTLTNIETAFADVSNIQYLSEAGEVLKAYLDGVGLKTITHDIENGTYTIEVSTDAVVAEIKSLRALITAQQTA